MRGRARALHSLHRSVLPEPPSWHEELDRHPFGELFRAAEEEHLQSHLKMNSWTEIDQKEAHGKVLDCMWVYIYKFNKHGAFVKCKARLIV